MCYFDGDSYWDVARTDMSRAAKPHRCGECGRTIEKGERYERFTGLWEKDCWFTHHTCAHCHAARHWLQVECSGWMWELVHDDLKEHFEEQPDLHLGRLVVGMRRAWRRRDGSLMEPIEGDPATWEAKRRPALMR